MKATENTRNEMFSCFKFCHGMMCSSLNFVLALVSCDLSSQHPNQQMNKAEILTFVSGSKKRTKKNDTALKNAMRKNAPPTPSADSKLGVP